MIVGVGIDLASRSRTREIIERFGERFTRRVFTDAETAYCLSRPDPGQSFAARFAAKEAVMKALASGWGGPVRFKDIEVVREESGRPGVLLQGGARARAEELGVTRFHVSLAHEGDAAAAYAVAESA